MANKFLTAEGLMIQRLDDILTAQRKKAEVLFQDQVPEGTVIDTSEKTGIGRLIALAAPATADLWEALQEVDSSFDPDKATGLALDKIVKYGAITRLKEQSATCSALFTGDGSVVIPYNSAIRASVTSAMWRTRAPLTLTTTNSSGVHLSVNAITNSSNGYNFSYTTPSGTKTVAYTSDSSATIDEIINGILAAAVISPHGGVSGYLDIERLTGTDIIRVTKRDPYELSTFTTDTKLTIVKWVKVGQLIAESTGAIDQPANTVTSIATPIIGWDSVYNYTAAVGGSGVETDDELRTRFRDTKYERASNILESLYSSLLSADGVTEVVIYENDTDVLGTTEVATLPKHSFMAIVNGGVTDNLAQIIWQNKPLGIQSWQVGAVDTWPYAFDSQGFKHYIGVSRPVNVPIYISIDLTVDTRFPADGELQIKQALYEYFLNNFTIGSDVIYSRLYTPINGVVGHQVNTLFSGIAASPSTSTNLTIAFNEIATLDVNHIVITYTT